MATQKMVLELEEFEEEYSLVAIHCSVASHKMAFILNKRLNTRLTRRPIDLEFSNRGLEVTFPLYQYDDNQSYTSYYLIGNACHSQAAQLQSSGGLFNDQSDTSQVTTFLIPEFRKADYFLKVESDLELIPLDQMVSELNQVNEVVTAYQVEPDRIKSKNNLIFD
ncbi:IPExxxVDY family protein [Aureitalea marina]|uniref:IPExxxVDY family protein n=1 Tax=Aureitalea marina TaxID=930804 RepID=A0A2S7KRU4_9FLAO|nr:IPExxxVDY family protein [Aureitalea marina]PQB05352.1 hypothetical protein BST85_10990 [Aureitalea marina]